MTEAQWQYADVAALIDHALLKPALTRDEIEAGCDLAMRYGVASVCVMPCWVGSCARRLAGSGVAVGTTVGFPHGGHAKAVKNAEAKQALSDGATELDMVVAITKARSGLWEDVMHEVREVVETAHGRGALLKVIFENGELDDEEKRKLCQVCADAGADWVKTATGFGPSGATAEDVQLMRAEAPEGVGVKAAGGIKTLDDVLAMRALGCSRVGCSNTAEILEEAATRLADAGDG